jgi:drug/metabolite transporter (DMT)-like permease
LNGGTFELQTGLIFCFLSAICYAGFFILTGHFAGKDDPLVLGSLEIAFVGVFCTIGALLVETPQLPATPMEWEIIVALVLVCSVFGFTFQPVAQCYIPAERAGLFCALSPLCAAIMGCVFLGETLGAAGIVGGTLIIAGILYHNGHELLKQLPVSLHHAGILKKV